MINETIDSLSNQMQDSGIENQPIIIYLPSAIYFYEFEKSAPRQAVHAGNLLPFILVTTLFFLWGIPNNLNDVLIKQFMKSFELTRFQAGLIQSAFYRGILSCHAGSACDEKIRLQDADW
jgi:fucose permease